jgi:hypothetical protein
MEAQTAMIADFLDSSMKSNYTRFVFSSLYSVCVAEGRNAMDFHGEIVTANDLLLSMFPSNPERDSNERRITLTVNAELSSQLRLRDVANQFRELCMWRQTRLVIGGKTVEQEILPIARALRKARHAKVPHSRR